MPQKKNPDALELLRGKSARTIGHTVTLLTMMKGLPTAYNKDMQEDKQALFDALGTAEAALQIADGVLATLTPREEKMRKALNSFMLATDLSEYLVRKGVPFRETHHISGRAVQMAEERGCELTELTVADLKTLHPLFTDDVRSPPGAHTPHTVHTAHTAHTARANPLCGEAARGPKNGRPADRACSLLGGHRRAAQCCKPGGDSPCSSRHLSVPQWRRGVALALRSAGGCVTYPVKLRPRRGATPNDAIVDMAGHKPLRVRAPRERVGTGRDPSPRAAPGACRAHAHYPPRCALRSWRSGTSRRLWSGATQPAAPRSALSSSRLPNWRRGPREVLARRRLPSGRRSRPARAGRTNAVACRVWRSWQGVVW